MNSGPFKYATDKICQQIIYIQYMYKQELA